MSRVKRVRKNKRAVSRSVWVVFGLFVFVAVDVLLVAMALGWGREELQASEWQASRETSSHTDDDSEGATDEPRPIPQSEDAQATPRLLSAVSETVAWRSEGGACEERGEIELTVDGGQTWGSAYPVEDDLGRALWLSGADYTVVQAAIASGENCSLEGVRTYDSGASWIKEAQVIANSVAVDPSDRSSLIWGGETVQGPCNGMTHVAVTREVASAVCDDGSLWSVEYGSSEWAQTAVDRAFALSASEGRWVAAVESAACDGVSLVEFDATSVQPLSCAPAQPSESMALDFSENTLWLWAGERVSVSTDLGRSLDS